MTGVYSENRKSPSSPGAWYSQGQAMKHDRRQRGALGQRRSDQVLVGRMDRPAAHPHGVDHRHAAGGDVVAVAHPAARLPANVLPEIGARSPHEVEQALGLGVHRFGRARDAPVDSRADLVVGLEIAQQIAEF